MNEPIKCVAFDCFGTVFDMKNIPSVEIRAYVKHVRQNDFSPYIFPENWWSLKAHPDSARGIAALQAKRIFCVALSNGDANLIDSVSEQNGISWDYIIDLAGHGVYKPHLDAYRTIEKDTGFSPSVALMVTANPTFGDVEGAASVGMRSQVIRHPNCPRDIIDLAELVERINGQAVL